MQISIELEIGQNDNYTTNTIMQYHAHHDGKNVTKSSTWSLILIEFLY